eukprot:7865469-Alexandrium_andersonii.AAC.1
MASYRTWTYTAPWYPRPSSATPGPRAPPRAASAPHPWQPLFLGLPAPFAARRRGHGDPRASGRPH